MKNSLRKLRGFALHKHDGDAKDRRDLRPLAQLDELAQASQDMQDMKDCYDSLLAAAAATANSAYEFSESLREMGACLLEKTALNDDEESGKVLLMLGKVQFELQLLVDSYRSHIFKTITSPSESLLNELRTVEEMKRQCEEKRDIYEYIRTRPREKGRSKSTKGESFTLQQLQTARDEYDEEATLFVFRLKSLKQGQSRSLLTQAARHHAAQLFFFKKALKSLEAIEPQVKWVTENQHIDYHFNGVEDDDGDDDNDDEDVSSYDSDSYYGNDDGELSFDYGKNENRQRLSALRPSMELDQVDVNFPRGEEAIKENIDKSGLNAFSYKARSSTGSQSAPLFSENKHETLPKISQKFRTYALPTPADTRSSNAANSVNPVSGDQQNLWHSTPLQPKKYEKLVGDEKTSGHAILNADNVLKDSNNNGGPSRLPSPTDRILLSRHHQTFTDAKKLKRQAFSGPLTGKSQPSIPATMHHPKLFSGPLLPNPPPRSISPVSPKFVSSPKISELHELPRPPSSSTLKSTRPSGFVSHSSPLLSKDQLNSTINKKMVKTVASPLPAPPQTINRSVSVPSRDPRERFSNESKLIESAPTEMEEDIPSPTPAPMRLSRSLILSSGSPNAAHVVHVKGVD